MMDILRKISSQIAAGSSSTLAKNPAIQLPALPFDHFDDLSQFDGRLKDRVFMDQMVSFLIHNNQLLWLFTYTCLADELPDHE